MFVENVLGIMYYVYFQIYCYCPGSDKYIDDIYNEDNLSGLFLLPRHKFMYLYRVGDLRQNVITCFHA